MAESVLDWIGKEGRALVLAAMAFVGMEMVSMMAGPGGIAEISIHDIGDSLVPNQTVGMDKGLDGIEV